MPPQPSGSPQLVGPQLGVQQPPSKQVWPEPHVAQALPGAPQAVGLAPGSQLTPAQQPLAHELPVQRQPPSSQTWPCAHAPAAHVPPQPSSPPQLVQLGVQQPLSKHTWPEPQASQALPPPPQTAGASPGSQIAPAQQPRGHETGVQAQAPARHV